LAGLDGRAKRRVDASHAALELESVLVEKLREPRRCLDLLIPELGMIVDLARQRLEVGGKAVNGGPDQVFDGAHGKSLPRSQFGRAWRDRRQLYTGGRGSAAWATIGALKSARPKTSQVGIPAKGASSTPVGLRPPDV